MDGPFYCDLKPPFTHASGSTTTLTTVNQALYPTGWLPQLGGYFNYVGKLLYIRSIGAATSGTTPGNFGFNLFWGNNTANNGNNLGGGVATAWTASITNAAWQWEAWIRCRALGTSGSLFTYGFISLANSFIIQFPYSNPVATTVDLTANNVISPQVNRSGSTVETITPYEITFQALN